MTRFQRAEQQTAVSFCLNGAQATVIVHPRTSLADALRDSHLSLGTRLGCEHGVCGACTVLVDGSSCRSCLLLAVQCDGSNIHTVEGMSPGEGRLHLIQEAFREFHALQCGFCTSGMLMVSLELLQSRKGLTEVEIREALSGNLCRCTGYQGIVDAILWLDEHWDRSGSELHSAPRDGSHGLGEA